MEDPDAEEDTLGTPKEDNKSDSDNDKLDVTDDETKEKIDEAETIQAGAEEKVQGEIISNEATEEEEGKTIQAGAVENINNEIISNEATEGEEGKTIQARAVEHINNEIITEEGTEEAMTTEPVVQDDKAAEKVDGININVQAAEPAVVEETIVEPASVKVSAASMMSVEDDADDKFQKEVVYEWKEELDEYDEPDIYPSDKDYQWVKEMVEVAESEDVPPSMEEEQKAESITQAEDGQQVGLIVAAEAEKKERDIDAVSEIAEDKGVAELEIEGEKDEAQRKKKFTTVLVRKLIERPPKIHYEPEEERTPYTTDNLPAFTVPPFSLLYSFGYDSQRMTNLFVLDENTLVYMAGFVLTFLNHRTMEKSYLRCLGGSCFGALAIHPSKMLFVAAEKGYNPVIGIWSWPKLQLFRKLKEGTDKVYASVNFSPDGKHLASQGGDPDYLITVWNWLAESPLLRVKSHAQDVFRVTFSKELAGMLTTSGLCHIKFWKMAATFTGLKLKGDIGRFGRTELSDIEGYVEMPDGKVLSGTEWGNLLVWENGLIVAELCIKNEIPCHDGIIRQVLLNEGEFYTTGQDGMVKTWSFDTVDAAEISTSEESLKVPMKVLAQVNVGDGSDIWSIVQDLADTSSNAIFWFAQDGRGIIWKVDLSFLNTAKEPIIISTAHGGPIVACKFCSVNCLFVTLGADGQVRVYNCITRELVAKSTFSSRGSCLIWPSILDPYSTTMIAGFADGTFRVLVLSDHPSGNLPMTLNLEQVRKPHGRKLTTMQLDSDGEFLVTGSKDGTIFFFDVRKDFQPMAFVQMPDWKAVRIVTWSKNTSDRKTVFVALDGGTIQEVLAPKWDEIDNEMSFFHVNSKLLRRYDFMSIKSQLRHNEELQRERIAEEARQAALDETNRTRITDGLETQSQQDLRLLHEAEELERTKADEKPKKKWEPFIPSETSPILLMIPNPFTDNEMLLSMGKYDAGYLYMIKIADAEENTTMTARPREPFSAIPVPDSGDVPITAFSLNAEGDRIFWGFEDGRVRIQKLSFAFDYESVGPHWTEGIHDCIRGSVTSITIDREGVFMVTSGQDGNCFLHSLLPPQEVQAYMSRVKAPRLPVRPVRTDVQDILSPSAYTLEISKTIEKELALLAAAKRNKAAKHEEIVRLRLLFYDIVKRNSELPEHARLSDVEFTITKDSANRREIEMQHALRQLHLELAWETERCTIALKKLTTFYNDPVDCNLFTVKAFNSNLSVRSFRVPTFPPFFELAKDKIMNQRTPRGVDSSFDDEEISGSSSTIFKQEQKPKRKHGMDKFVYQRIVRLWERKLKKIDRRRVWKDFLATEPKGKELKEEDKAIEEARMTIGDMKLKMALDYKVPDSKKLTEHRGRKRLVYLEETVYKLKSDFNRKLLKQREYKMEIMERIQGYRKIIVEHQSVLPDEEKKKIPYILPMTPEENPKSFMEYTHEDIRAYKQNLEEKMRLAATQVTVAKPKKVEAPVKRKHHGTQIYRKVSSTSKIHSVDRTDDDKPKEEGFDLGNFVEFFPCEPSSLEKHLMRVKLESAKHYQDYYIKKVNEEIFIFNSQIKMLKHRKAKLDFLLKSADQGMVMLTQEFMLAQRSEAMEAAMEVKILDANRERKEYAAHIKALTRKHDVIKKDLDGFAKQRNVLLQEVMQIASKVPAFDKYLIRVFNKKLAKPKPKVVGVRSSESVESSGSEDSSESSSDMDMDLDEDADDGLDIDFPPPELNKDVYDQVVDVRSGRLLIDENELAAKEVSDELGGNINAFKAKIHAADKEFEKGRRELEAFAKEKQQFLNDIDMAVSLNLHQIQHMDKDFNDALVTENKSIIRLRHRIPELQKEKRLQRKTVLEVRKEHLQLLREKHRFLNRLEEMNKKCDVEMLKKFGVVTDIEILENFCIDPEIVALKKELHATELQNALELEGLGKEQEKIRDKRMLQTDKQSVKYFTMTELIKQIARMTRMIDEDMKRLPSEYEDNITKIETSYFTNLVEMQWNMLRSLKEEIVQLTNRRIKPLPPIGSHKIQDENL